MFQRWSSMGAWAMLLVAFNDAHGQLNLPERDSLAHELSVRTAPIERLPALRKMAWTYFFSPEARPYLHEMDSLTAGLVAHPDTALRRQAVSYRAWMFYIRGYQHKFRRNMAAALADLRESVRFAQASHDTLLIANGLGALGTTYLALDLPAQALGYYDQELELIMATAEKAAMYTSDIRQHQAEAMMRMGRYQEARAALMHCDTTARLHRALTLMGLGQLHACEGDTMVALSVMARARREMQNTEERWDRLRILQPIARMQWLAGLNADALSTTTEAIRCARELGDDAALAGCLVIAGRLNRRLGDDAAAETCFREAMGIAQRGGFVGLARETGDEGSLVHAAEALTELYKSQGRVEEALLMAEQLVSWKDSIHAMEGREALLRFELQQAALTDSIADAQRIATATHGLRDTLERERAQQRTVLLVAGALLTIASFAGYLLWSRRKRQRLLAEHTLERQVQERMISDLRMRELMSEDLHEELGAGLSALKLWNEMDLAEETDPRRRQLLAKRSAMADELVASLRQIIWAMNSPTTTVKQLADYLVDHAHLQCTQLGLRLVVTCGQEWPALVLGPEQRRSPFLAVKEFLNNTARHSGADRVELDIRWEGGLRIDLRDNGKGTSATPESLPGNGLRLMHRRIAAIGGTVRMDGTEGMHVRIHIPLDAMGDNESSKSSGTRTSPTSSHDR